MCDHRFWLKGHLHKVKSSQTNNKFYIKALKLAQFSAQMSALILPLCKSRLIKNLLSPSMITYHAREEISCHHATSLNIFLQKISKNGFCYLYQKREWKFGCLTCLKIQRNLYQEIKLPIGSCQSTLAPNNCLHSNLISPLNMWGSSLRNQTEVIFPGTLRFLWPIQR